MDFSLDRLEDVRLAVDETASMLIKGAQPDSELEVELNPQVGGQLDLTFSVQTATGALPATNSFSWTVLTALVDDVRATVDATHLSIHLRASATENTVSA
jgi:serine/threonine-protein kinase RsbW